MVRAKIGVPPQRAGWVHALKEETRLERKESSSEEKVTVPSETIVWFRAEVGKYQGVTHFETTAYHPVTNGMVERCHRQLKAAIKCHEHSSWTEALPAVMLGIRAAWKDDLRSTIAEMVYGEPLRLPGEFLTTSQEPNNNTPADFVQILRQHTQLLTSIDGTRHGKKTPILFKDLAATEQILVRRYGPKSLTTLLRLKKAYVLKEEESTDVPKDPEQQPEPPAQPNVALNQPTRNGSGRSMHFSDRLQVQ
ncbi:uncharacterized protein LOC108742987 [Agrilus planipennis]|uniref:Uncharacterized protein LOC108742987 n=1 Tax=Agrilus planipennis TaxID=224129 RepID=A0A1W4XM77_AGRPL|nr:uncharacterized protein LOC108742987 [Agrilus planipennis]